MAQDVDNETHLSEQLDWVVRSVATRLQKNGLKGKTVYVKLRLADFTTFTRQFTLPYHTNDEEPIKEAAWALLAAELEPGRAFRLLGVGMANFGSDPEVNEQEVHQLSLFADVESAV